MINVCRSPVTRWAVMPLAVTIGLMVSGAASAGAAAGRYVAVNGSGSTWAAIAIDEWAQQVQRDGIPVSFNADGSLQGRADYIAGIDDFAVTDDPFRTGNDKLGGTGPEPVPWGYSYVPGPAGGVAFPYHISVHGHWIHNLRLSPAVLLDIFTGKITNWDSPLITREYGHQLPNLRITPVVHSEGSGLTYYFTSYLAQVFTPQWNRFCKLVDPSITLPCGPTEFYPSNFGNVRAENGSAGVMAYIASPEGNGAIGYDEYTYPLLAHFPVVKLQNPAGDYVRPTARNVTTALRRATVIYNPRSRYFLQVDLSHLYTYKNPGNYPLSYTSYLVVPRAGTKPPPSFTNAKGRTLSAFLDYAICAGQRHIGGFGYAPLPPNLVESGLLQIENIPGHGHVPTLSQCR